MPESAWRHTQLSIRSKHPRKHARKRNGMHGDSLRDNVNPYAGLPFRGAPLLLPADINITLVTGGLAAQAGIAAPLLYTQLSLAGLLGLSSLANSYRAQPAVRACSMCP